MGKERIVCKVCGKLMRLTDCGSLSGNDSTVQTICSRKCRKQAQLAAGHDPKRETLGCLVWIIILIAVIAAFSSK